MQFSEELFEDTIFDGEMVKVKNGEWCFIMNDMLVCKGVHLQNVNLPKRINMLYETLRTCYVPGSFDLFKVAVKTYFRYDQIEHMLQTHVHNLPYTCRGLYFKPLFLRFKDILLNFDDNLIKKVERVKYKNVKSFILMEEKNGLHNKGQNTPNIDDDNSSTTSHDSKVSKVSGFSSRNSSTFGEISQECINQIKTEAIINCQHVHTEPLSKGDKLGQFETKKKLYVRKTGTPDIYELYDHNISKLESSGIACVPTLKISKFMRDKTKDMNMVDKIELEFEFSEKFQKWIPIC
jgi:hypothetical protein